MIRHLFLLSLSLLLAIGTHAQAGLTRSYSEALKKAGNDKPVILFCYGANFDQVGKAAYDAIIRDSDKELKRVLNKEIYVVIPIYQFPNEKEQAEFKRIMGKHKLPGGIWSYPCFAIVDGKGNFRGAVQSAAQMENPKIIQETLTKLLGDFDKQQKLLAQASRASGANKRRLMREALSITSIKPPDHEPFDPANNGMVQKIQLMSIAEANRYIRGTLAEGIFTPVERQMIMATYAGHLRRNNAPVDLLRAVYTEMRNIDPTSIYGAYAEGALEIWVDSVGKK